jgi:hypothetical protein
MANLAKAGTLVMLVALGCSSFRTPAEVPTDEKGDAKQPPPNPNRIEIGYGFSSGIYGGPKVRAKWVLEKSGPCRGTVTTGTNADSRQDSTTEYELPAETFDQCRGLLQSTNFLNMHVKRPDFLFEASGWNITAHWNGRTNSVDAYSNGPPTPEGLIRLRDFLDGLPQRGKVISSNGPPAP